MHEFERDLMSALSGSELDDLLAFATQLQRRLREVAPEARLGIR
jgi:hypothetical protein